MSDRYSLDRRDKKLAGVCSTIGDVFNIDPTLVRIAAVVALCLGFPAVAIGYLVAWTIVPKA